MKILVVSSPPSEALRSRAECVRGPGINVRGFAARFLCQIPVQRSAYASLAGDDRSER